MCFRGAIADIEGASAGEEAIDRGGGGRRLGSLWIRRDCMGCVGCRGGVSEG